MKRNRSLIMTALMLASTQASWAAGGSGMPWDAPLQKIANDLSGPTVASIAVIAIVVTACTLIFGGNLPEWGKSVAIVGLAIALAVGASSFLLNVFGVSAALI